MKTKAKTYNHMFNIAFTVPDSVYENDELCLLHERSKVVRAILRRIESVMELDEFVEAVGHCDTYENED